jgi:PKD repeat protein
LVNNSPLSDTVIASLLKGNHVHGKIKKVLLQNLAFSEYIENLFNNIGLESSIIQEVNNLRSNNIPQDFVLLSFQSQFPGFKSYLNKFMQDEFIFLKNGGDPQDPNNPANKVRVDRTLAALFNANQEIKVGNSIMVMLPKRDVMIKNGDINILNYIRKNGILPINIPKGTEPDNGFPIKIAPAPVDSNIVVQPVEQVNGACGGTISNQPSASARYSFSSGIKGTGLTYYWNFGDGYVSFKENPTHTFPDRGVFNVTVTVYDSEGSGCTPPSGFQVGNGSNTTNGTACTIAGNGHVNISSNYNNVIFTATGLSSSYDYSWTFGDGGSAHGAQVNHSYQVGGTYPVTLIVTDNSGCTWSYASSIQVSNPQQPIVTPSCCDKYDKVMDSWHSPDSYHKFRHILNVKSLLIGSSRVSGEVITYHKFIFANWWIIYPNSSSVNVSGNVYAQDINNNSCGRTLPISYTLNNGWALWNTASYDPLVAPIYTEYNSATSSATAFGVTDVLSVSSCK